MSDEAKNENQPVDELAPGVTGDVHALEDKKPHRSRTSKTSAEKIVYQENVRKAIEFRKRGFTYDEILTDLPNVWKSVQACQDAVSRALDKALLDDARELKLLNLARLEKCFAAVLQKAEKGNLLAVDRVIRLSKREGEILGFDEINQKDLNVGFEIVVRNESDRPKDKSS